VVETLPLVDDGSGPKAPATGREPQLPAIRSAVLAALGRPANLLRVAIAPLWGDRFRVNVFTGDDLASASIPHSYFLAADARGNVLECSPAIRKVY